MVSTHLYETAVPGDIILITAYSFCDNLHKLLLPLLHVVTSQGVDVQQDRPPVLIIVTYHQTACMTDIMSNKSKCACNASAFVAPI